MLTQNDSHNKYYGALLKKSPPAFQPENNVIILIKVADSESDFGFYNKGLVSEIFALHLQEKSHRRPGRRGHVQLVPK